MHTLILIGTIICFICVAIFFFKKIKDEAYRAGIMEKEAAYERRLKELKPKRQQEFDPTPWEQSWEQHWQKVTQDHIDEHRQYAIDLYFGRVSLYTTFEEWKDWKANPK
jgi:hypothetical protein